MIVTWKQEATSQRQKNSSAKGSKSNVKLKNNKVNTKNYSANAKNHVVKANKINTNVSKSCHEHHFHMMDGIRSYECVYP